MLQAFAASVTIDTPIFKDKYGHLIARDFGMPFDNVAEKRAVLHEVFCMESFSKAMEIPQIARWMSWNSSAQAQVKEFHATKMILEAYFVPAC